MASKKAQKPRSNSLSNSRSKLHAEPAGDSQFRSLIETALHLVVVPNYSGKIRYSIPSAQLFTDYSPA